MNARRLAKIAEAKGFTEVADLLRAGGSEADGLLKAVLRLMQSHTADVWTVPDSAVFHHRALADQETEIRRHGLRPSRAGTIGAGVYLMPPSVDPDHFFLHAQAGKDTVVIAARVPGARLLRFDRGGNAPLNALRALHGAERGVEVYDTRSIMYWLGEANYHTPFTGLIEHLQANGIDGLVAENDREAVIFAPRKVKVIKLGHST